MKRKRGVFLFLLVILIILSGFFLFRSNLFTVNSLAIQMEKTHCADENQIRDFSGVLGQNFLLINPANLESNLKNKFICIKTVDVSSNFPNKIKLFISGREPAAILIVLKNGEASESARILEEFSRTKATSSAEATPSASTNFYTGEPAEKFVVDNEGIIYSTDIEQISAPKIYISGIDVGIGEKQDSLIHNGLRILEKVKNFALNIEETKIYSNNLLLTGNTTRVIFKLTDNIDTQIASLQLILDKAKIDNETLEFIDLRFDKPVVRFAPKQH